MPILVIVSYHKINVLTIVDGVLFIVGVALLWSFYQDYKVGKAYKKARDEKERYVKAKRGGGLHG